MNGIPMLYLLRHAEPEEGYTRRYLGRLNPGISPVGVTQAEAAAKLVRSLKPEICHCSPLNRARLTADIVTRNMGIGTVVEESLMEIDFGQLEGMTFAEGRAVYPLAVDSWAALTQDFAFPGGENYAAFQGRLDKLVALAMTAIRSNVLMVAHGGILRGLVCRLLGLDCRGNVRFRFKYAGIAGLELFDGGGAVLTGFNL